MADVRPGAHSVSYVPRSGTGFYVKDRVKDSINKWFRKLRNAESSLFRGLGVQTVRTFRDYFEEDKLVKAGATMYLWRRHGVSTPRLTCKEDRVEVEAVDGRSVAAVLSGDNSGETVVDRLMDTVVDIRDVAYRLGNNHLFHLDMHLDNFIYDEDDDEVYAIDPGIEFRPCLDTRSIDVGSHLLLLYGLDAVGDARSGYVEQAVRQLPCRLNDAMRRENRAGQLMEAYFSVRRSVINKVTGADREQLVTARRADRINNTLEDYL